MWQLPVAAHRPLFPRNSESVTYFWQNWNIPVHKWCLRYVGAQGGDCPLCVSLLWGAATLPGPCANGGCCFSGTSTSPC